MKKKNDREKLCSSLERPKLDIALTISLKREGFKLLLNKDRLLCSLNRNDYTGEEIIKVLVFCSNGVHEYILGVTGSV